MLRSALLVLSGNAAASIFLLARNLLLARLIPVEDYGVAATFAIAMAVVEMASQLGLQQQIVQAREGEDARFQAALQGFQVLRGLLAGVALFLAAGAIAGFLNIPQVAWAYQVLALVPVLNALQHFDIHRLNRQMRFGPMLLTGLVPALLSLGAIWPLASLLGDWRAMLWALVLQAALAAATSHLVAERPYRLAFDRAVMARSLRFGWPLLLNGVLLFAVFQGDKLIVGRELGMAPLAIFAMGVTLTLTPTLVMAKSAQNFFLPGLSRAAGDAEAFAARGVVALQAVLLAALALTVVLAAAAGPLVALLLGERYAPLAAYLPWLAILQALRVAKAGPAIVALAAGRTANALVANVPRALLLAAAWHAAAAGGGLMQIIAIAILGEAAGLVLSLLLLRDRLPVTGRAVALPHLAAAGVLGLAGHAALGGPPGGVGLALLAAGLLAAALAMTDLMSSIRRRAP